MCMPPPIHSSPTDGRTDSFSIPIFPSSRNLFFLEDFSCYHTLRDSRSTSYSCGEEVFDWVISSDLLPLNDPDTPTLLYCSSGELASLLTSPLLPLFLPILAPGRCFKTWILTIYYFFCPSLSLQPITPTSVPLPSIF